MTLSSEYLQTFAAKKRKVVKTFGSTHPVLEEVIPVL
jgi:hypothetical protein